jgi:xanthine dehydrogenase accessory factor
MEIMPEAGEIWAEAVRTLESDRPFALATVINVRGSTPREIGAKMLVRHDGQVGTIGGGCGEAEVFRKARLLLDEGQGARMTEVDLTGDPDQNEIGTCGGLMDVFIGLWNPKGDLPMAQRLAKAAAHNEPAALLTLVDASGKSDLTAGAKAIVTPSANSIPELASLGEPALDSIRRQVQEGNPALFEIDRDDVLKLTTRVEPPGMSRVFVDPVSAAQRLIIVGAGHIAQPLAELGSMLGFHVTVIDDRASFANRERFPTADEITVKPFKSAIESIRLDKHCYLISVTRGHAFDEETLRAALSQKARDAFLGMIGSKRRVRATLERIEADGVERELLDEIHAPIGLDIGAQTPAEIAVAIMAEIIRERRFAYRDELTLGVKSGRLRRNQSA